MSTWPLDSFNPIVLSHENSPVCYFSCIERRLSADIRAIIVHHKQNVIGRKGLVSVSCMQGLLLFVGANQRTETKSQTW